MVAIVGLLFVGLVVRTVLAVAVIAAIVWLVLKLGRLADAYTEKLKSSK